MYKPLRQYSVGLFIAVVLTGIVFSWLSYSVQIKRHIQVNELRHLALTRVLENTLAHIYLPLLQSASRLSAEERAQHRLRLHQAADNALAGTNVLRFELYDLTGKSIFVYPNDAEQIEFGALARARAALQGDVVTNLLSGDRPYDVAFTNKDVLETYVATSVLAFNSRQQEPVGVIELYTDITGQVSRARWDALAQSALIVAALVVLCGALLVAVRYVDRKNDNQPNPYRSIERAEKEPGEDGPTRSDLITRLSHELRTPMNTVMGTADLLLQTDLDAKQRDYVKTVAASGESLLHVIDKVLQLASVKAGQLVIKERIFHPHNVLRDIEREFKAAAVAKGLALIYRSESTVEAVYGDPERLHQILANLVDNAVKFSNSGQIIVSAWLLNEADDKVWLRFSVEDSGSGIDTNNQRQVFEPFAQTEPSTADGRSGVGLGLAISRHIVEELGGEIGVDSLPGKGSTFWFVLPFSKRG